MNKAFNFEKEFKNFKNKREEKGLHGDKGLKELGEMKEKWKFQKMGLAEIQEKIVNDIAQNKDNFKADDFMEEHKDLMEKYLLDDDVIKKIKKALRVCEKRSVRIREIEKEFLSEAGEIDDEKVFKEVFDFDPSGDIRVIFRPLAIYFKMENEKDFAKIYSGAFLSKRDIKERDLEISQFSAGALLGKAKEKNLHGAIMIENPEYFEDKDISERILIHEEVHAVNNVIFKAHLADEEMVLKLLDQIGEEDKERALDIIQNSTIEKQIKDEILANFGEKTDPQEISRKLLDDATGYDYGFDYNFSETDGDYMHPEYIKIVQNGIISFARLLRAGFDIKTSKGLLVLEPLALWDRVADRIIGQKRNSKEKKDDIDKFIDKSIAKKIDIAKKINNFRI